MGERLPAGELSAEGPGGLKAGDRVRDLEEEGLGAVAVGDDKDLVLRPCVLERLREPEQPRGGAGIADLGDQRLLRRRGREAELPDERGVQPGVGRAEDEPCNVALLPPGLGEETVDRLGKVPVEAVRLYERHVGQHAEVAVTLTAPHVGELTAHRVSALEGRDDSVGAHQRRRRAVAEQALELGAGRDRPHVGGGDQGLRDRPRSHRVERQAERRRPAAQRSAEVGRDRAGSQIAHGREQRRGRLLGVRGRGRGKEARADPRNVAAGEGGEGRLARHGQAILVVVGERALAVAPAAPRLAEESASEAVARDVSADAH